MKVYRREVISGLGFYVSFFARALISAHGVTVIIGVLLEMRYLTYIRFGRKTVFMILSFLCILPTARRKIIKELLHKGLGYLIAAVQLVIIGGFQ
jgi:hypothetical protein